MKNAYMTEYNIEQIQELSASNEFSLAGFPKGAQAKKDQQFLNKVLQNLYVGKKFASYGELCRVLDTIPGNGSKRKREQKQKFSRFFEFTHSPTGEIEITNIKLTSLPIRGIYVELFQKIFLLLFGKDETLYPEMDDRKVKCIEITHDCLCELFGVYNPDYYYYLRLLTDNHVHLPQKTLDGIQIEYWMNFYFWSRKKSKESIKSALNSMKNRDILDYNLKVKYKQNGQYQICSIQESEEIKQMENDILLKYYHYSPAQKWLLIISNRWQEYQDHCRKDICKAKNWEAYHWIYQIWCRPSEVLREEYTKFPKGKTSLELYEQYFFELNALMNNITVDAMKELLVDTGYVSSDLHRMISRTMDIKDFLNRHNETFEHYSSQWIG